MVRQFGEAIDDHPTYKWWPSNESTKVQNSCGGGGE